MQVECTISQIQNRSTVIKKNVLGRSFFSTHSCCESNGEQEKKLVRFIYGCQGGPMLLLGKTSRTSEAKNWQRGNLGHFEKRLNYVNAFLSLELGNFARAHKKNRPKKGDTYENLMKSSNEKHTFFTQENPRFSQHLINHNN